MSGYTTFVVKIWFDKVRGLFRGQVQNVSTEESKRFVDWRRMVQFMHDQANAHDDTDDTQ